MVSESAPIFEPIEGCEGPNCKIPMYNIYKIANINSLIF